MNLNLNNNSQIQKIQPFSHEIKKEKKQILDVDKVANGFIGEYYKCVSNNGWTNVMYLFSSSCNIIFKEKKFSNPYEFLHYLFCEMVKKANYDNLKAKWILIDDETILISVFGQIQFVLFDNTINNPLVFAETFVIKLENSVAKCVSHIIDF